MKDQVCQILRKWAKWSIDAAVSEENILYKNIIYNLDYP